MSHFIVNASRFFVGCSVATGVFAHGSEGEFDFFEEKIRPVLVEHCYECHSVEAANHGKLKAGLLLDSRDGIRMGGDTGPAVVLGDSSKSLLLRALKQEGPEMPPSGALADDVIADFTQWIEAGAPDPRDSSELSLIDLSIDASDHWAFKPPVEPILPKVRQESWPRSPIDYFILSELEQKELQPVSPASARTLVRRIFFNLIGLPPSPEEVDHFLEKAQKDQSLAVTELVDELLKSPHYGERWGRHWLDVARYAEDQAHTFGVKKRENAHQYRDWVIQMFNEDLPFDQFVQRQVAGDLMAITGENLFRQYSGLGFLGLGAQYYKNSDKAKAEADELDDTIDTLTRGFMGLTVSCARCHDHKFDPISIEDYYSLAGIFNGRRYSEVPLVEQEVVKAYNEEQKVIKDLESQHRSELRGLGKQYGKNQLQEISRYLQEGWRMGVLKSRGVKFSHEEYCSQRNLHPHFARRFQEMLEKGRKNDLEKRLPELQGWHDIEVDLVDPLSVDQLKVPEGLRSLADEFQKIVTEAQRSFSQIEAKEVELLAKARDEEDRINKILGKMEKDPQRVLKNIWTEGHAPLHASEQDVYQHFLQADGKKNADEKKAQIDSLRKSANPKYPVAHTIQGGGQAMQVYLRGNPETKGAWVARGNLSLLTDEPRPTDEQEAKNVSYTRLDLAQDIASRENPLTARVIVNRVWQWHFGRGLVSTASNFGLLGEKPSHPELLDWLTLRFIENKWSLKWLHREIMDSSTYQLSSASHSLNEQKDEDNVFRWRFDRRRLEVEAWRDALISISGQLDSTMGGPTFELSKNHTRRTVYGSVSRHQLDGMLRIFDFPDANVSSARRTQTTVPQQQLFVLNSDFMIGQAKAFAKLVSARESEVQAQVVFAYRRALGRQPTKQEWQLAEEFLSSETKPDDKLSRIEQYCQALLAGNELMYLD